MPNRIASAALGTNQRHRVGTATKKQKELLTQSLDRTLAAHRYLEKFSDQLGEEELAVLAIMAIHGYSQNILGPAATSKVWALMEKNSRAH